MLTMTSDYVAMEPCPLGCPAGWHLPPNPHLSGFTKRRPAAEPEQRYSVALGSISTDPPPPMLIDRLDPTGHTILYGTGGIGKGSLAASWIVELARDEKRVMILDYEGHPEEWSRRIGSLDRGVHVSEAVRHMKPPGPIHEQFALVRSECDFYHVDYVVVDSAVMACGADPLKPEAAAMYADAILAIGRPVLTLAHVTKTDDSRYPFGSIFWHNLARMTWSMTGDDDEILLKHRKHNNYRGLGTFALAITWADDGQLREVLERGYATTVLDRAVAEIPDGGISLEDLLVALNDDDTHKRITRDTLRRTLARAIPHRVRLSGSLYSRSVS